MSPPKAHSSSFFPVLGWVDVNASPVLITSCELQEHILKCSMQMIMRSYRIEVNARKKDNGSSHTDTHIGDSWLFFHKWSGNLCVSKYDQSNYMIYVFQVLLYQSCYKKQSANRKCLDILKVKLDSTPPSVTVPVVAMSVNTYIMHSIFKVWKQLYNKKKIINWQGLAAYICIL